MVKIGATYRIRMSVEKKTKRIKIIENNPKSTCSCLRFLSHFFLKKGMIGKRNKKGFSFPSKYFGSSSFPSKKILIGISIVSVAFSLYNNFLCNKGFIENRKLIHSFG